tara:strand:+ start:22596 stop:24647 length:2052 start_codon:yes stop_codon:yes gene_type:complete
MNMMGDIFNRIRQGKIKSLKQFLNRTSRLSPRDRKLPISEFILRTINRPNQFGTTPLMMAALSETKYGNEIFSLLLKHGALVNARDVDGCTVAHLLIKYGNIEKLTLLIELHPDCFLIPDNFGRTPLDYLKMSQHKGSDIDEIEDMLLSIYSTRFASCYEEWPTAKLKCSSRSPAASYRNLKHYNEKFNAAILAAGLSAFVQGSLSIPDVSLKIGLDQLLKAFPGQDMQSDSFSIERVDAKTLTHIAYGFQYVQDPIIIMRYIDKNYSAMSLQGQLACLYLMKELIVADLYSDYFLKKGFQKTYQKIWAQASHHASDAVLDLKVIMDRSIRIRRKYHKKIELLSKIQMAHLYEDVSLVDSMQELSLVSHKEDSISSSSGSDFSDIVLMSENYIKQTLDPKALADNIYLFDQVAYLSLSNPILKKGNQPLLTVFQNLLANKIRCDILYAKTSEDKLSLITYYCEAAELLLNSQKDHQGFFGIMTALSMVDERMMRYLECDKSLKQRLTKLQDLASPFGNFKVLRAMMASDKATLPAFQIISSDIAHIMDAGSSMLQKAESLGKLLLPINTLKIAFANRDPLTLIHRDEFQRGFLAGLSQVSHIKEEDISVLRDRLRDDMATKERSEILSQPGKMPPLDFTPLYAGYDNAGPSSGLLNANEASPPSSHRNWFRRTFTPKSSGRDH